MVTAGVAPSLVWIQIVAVGGHLSSEVHVLLSLSLSLSLSLAL